ncbi:MAG: hypothetical protein WCY71_12375, partial [Halothiobacillaceae bacterium]
MSENAVNGAKQAATTAIRPREQKAKSRIDSCSWKTILPDSLYKQRNFAPKAEMKKASSSDIRWLAWLCHESRITYAFPRHTHPGRDDRQPVDP